MSEFKSLYAAALAYLARREHSQWQLRQKLLVKFPQERALINQVIELLAQENYQSDARFADAYLYYRVQKGYGPKKIAYELTARGIQTVECDSAFARGDYDWKQLQEQARVKKFGTTPPTEFLSKAKQRHYLQQRGF